MYVCMYVYNRKLSTSIGGTISSSTTGSGGRRSNCNKSNSP